MANKKNKVKFGLQNVYWAKINEWGEDPDGNKTVPAYGPSKHLPGAVSLSIDANGEAENFYADNGVYYVINNNAGYTGDLEIALITTEFATEILGEILDNNGVLVEKNDTELAQFALMFEFLGDKHHIRHVMYCCSASRPATESATTEESTEVKTVSNLIRTMIVLMSLFLILQEKAVILIQYLLLLKLLRNVLL